MTRIEALKELIGRATAVPWNFVDCKQEWEGDKTYEVEMPNGPICSGFDDTRYYPTAPSKEDAQLIAASREALPELLELVEQLAEALDLSWALEYPAGKDVFRKRDAALQRFQAFNRGEG